jgi:hypothetical protein
VSVCLPVASSPCPSRVMIVVLEDDASLCLLAVVSGTGTFRIIDLLSQGSETARGKDSDKWRGFAHSVEGTFSTP